METAGHLPHQLLIGVFRALQKCGVGAEDLLHAVPTSIRAAIPSGTSPPSSQLMRTLQYLNECHTSDEQAPLVSFLEWAIEIAGPRVEATVLRQAVSYMGDAATLESVPEAERRRRAAFVSLVKRVYQHLGFEVDLPDHQSPVFVGWCDVRARVVGVVVGDLQRVIHVAREQLGMTRLAVSSIEGLIVFPEKEPSPEQRDAVLDAGLSPITLAELRRQKERADRRRASPAMDGLIARQIACAVEECQGLGPMPLFESLRDRTSERLLELVEDMRNDRLKYALIHVSDARALVSARCALLTLWYESLKRGRGRWPFHVSVEEPFPFDTDEVLDRTVLGQRVTLGSPVVRALFWDDESIPVICCADEITLPEVRRAVRAVLAAKARGIVLAPGVAAASGARTLLGFGSAAAHVCHFPSDFEPDGSQLA